MPTVSVVIPAFNAENFIVETINSVLNQTYKDIEIIVINDNSTDNTEEVILKTFKNLIGTKIIYIKNQKNIGRGKSANKGFKLSSGNYIFFIDADDLWKNNHIEKVLYELRKPNVDIIYAKPRTFINEKGEILRISKSKIEPNTKKLIYSCRVGFPSATAFKKESFLLYNPNFKYREDIELLIRSDIKRKNIKIIDINTVLIRQHSSPFRMSLNRNFYKYTLKLYEEYYDLIPAEFKSYFLLHVSEVAFKFGDFKTGYEMLTKSVKKKPSIILEPRNLALILKRVIRIDKLF
ncbi:glycosyltransferase family 2 protein [Desulfurobacterium sp.]